MKRVTIAVYKPKPHRDTEVLALVRRHSALLEAKGLITRREPIVMRAGDGTILEVFEWRSRDAIAEAHAHPAVLALWGEFEAVCDFQSLAALPEAQQPFAEFDGI
jgi:hypothetical protein